MARANAVRSVAVPCDSVAPLGTVGVALRLTWHAGCRRRANVSLRAHIEVSSNMTNDPRSVRVAWHARIAQARAGTVHEQTVRDHQVARAPQSSVSSFQGAHENKQLHDIGMEWLVQVVVPPPGTFDWRAPGDWQICARSDEECIGRT